MRVTALVAHYCCQDLEVGSQLLSPASVWLVLLTKGLAFHPDNTWTTNTCSMDAEPRFLKAASWSKTVDPKR